MNVDGVARGPGRASCVGARHVHHKWLRERRSDCPPHEPLVKLNIYLTPALAKSSASDVGVNANLNEGYTVYSLKERCYKIR